MLPERSEIHLWTAELDDFSLAELELICLAWLGKQDLQRYHRLVFERHRKQMLLSRYLLRATLSHYVDSLSLSDWRFTHNAYGKPALEQSVHPLDLFFNLSHSHGQIVLALAAHDFVGVDIEASTRSRRISRIARRYFSEAEAAELLELPEHLQLSRFYQLWTLKEAYIKACGMGLAIPLNQFSFRFAENSRICVQFDPQLNDEPVDWHFWQIDKGKNFQLSLALKLKDPAFPLRVRIASVGQSGIDQSAGLVDAIITGSSV